MNSTIEKCVRFADGIVTEPKVSASKMALKWKCKIANHKECKSVRQQLQWDEWNAMETGIMESRTSSSCGGLNDVLIHKGEFLSKTYKVPRGQIVSTVERASCHIN